MAKTFSEKMDKDPHWISNIWFTDEAHFHLNGAVNNWNNRFWGDERPDLTEPKCLKGPKVKIRSKSLDELKLRVEESSEKVAVSTCQKVIQNFAVRINACLNLHGGHIEHIDYKKI